MSTGGVIVNPLLGIDTLRSKIISPESLPKHSGVEGYSNFYVTWFRALWRESVDASNFPLLLGRIMFPFITDRIDLFTIGATVGGTFAPPNVSALWIYGGVNSAENLLLIPNYRDYRAETDHVRISHSLPVKINQLKLELNFLPKHELPKNSEASTARLDKEPRVIDDASATGDFQWLSLMLHCYAR